MFGSSSSFSLLPDPFLLGGGVPLKFPVDAPNPGRPNIHPATLSMRLLSFLDLVETALRADGLDLIPAQVTRQVNYEAGLARLELPGQISLVVQNFTLADGQLCLKAWWHDPVQGESAPLAFFDGAGNDWKTIARKVAAAKPESATSELEENADAARLAAG